MYAYSCRKIKFAITGEFSMCLLQILSLLKNPNHINFQYNYIPTMDSLLQNFIFKMKPYNLPCRNKEGDDKTGKGERTGDYK